MYKIIGRIKDIQELEVKNYDEYDYKVVAVVVERAYKNSMYSINVIARGKKVSHVESMDRNQPIVATFVPRSKEIIDQNGVKHMVTELHLERIDPYVPSATRG
jgi:hypothetical protein